MSVSDEKTDTLEADDISQKTTFQSQHTETLLPRSVTGEMMVEHSDILTETFDQTKQPKITQTPRDKSTPIRMAKSVGVRSYFQSKISVTEIRNIS